MDVLLISPPAREESKPQIFPVGLGYIASALKKAGHKVHVIDIDGNRYSEDKVKELVREHLVKKKINVVLIGGLITLYNYVKWLNNYIKKINPKATIIGGNSIISSISELALRELGYDYGVIGEGEITIVELINSIQNKKISGERSDIKGICYIDRKEDKLIVTANRPFIKDLDTIPFPSWELFNIPEYIKHPANGSGSMKKINISTNRGCPFNCNFCYKIWGRSYRSRSSKNILKEMDYLHKKYKVSYFMLGDDNFTIDKKRVQEFCDLLIKKKRKYKFSVSSRVDTLDEETSRKLKNAGCNYVGVGIESGSQKILDSMNKGFNVDKIEEGVKAMRRGGLEPYASFMINYPGETRKTIHESVALRKKLRLPGSFFITRPYPGTTLWTYTIQKGYIKNEKEYIEQLSEVCTQNKLDINYSNMSKKQLQKEIDWAGREINSYLPNTIHRYYRYFRSTGIHSFSFFNVNNYIIQPVLNKIKKIFN